MILTFQIVILIIKKQIFIKNFLENLEILNESLI